MSQSTFTYHTHTLVATILCENCRVIATADS